MDAARGLAERNGIGFIPEEGADHRFQNPKDMECALIPILGHFKL